MPQLVKKRRSRWAVLVVTAMVASLFAVGSAPTGAAEIKTGEDNKAEQSAKATFSACVGAALEDAGFTDLGGTGQTHVSNINCLASYGISKGTSATTFDPNSNVTRRHMAVFLYRAADAAGIDLTGGDMSADFGDIDMLGDDMQNAINALARNDILAGRGMGFEPYADITRAEMAVALVNLTRHTAPSKFVQAGTDKGKLADSDGAALAADKVDYFADARRTVPAATNTHISYAYELGITSGTGDGTTFSPSAPVARRHMATFIMNALAHSNLRPAGLTVQSDNGELTASLRDADFEPVANELIDAFYVSTARVGRAFNNDGECRSIVKAVDDSTGTANKPCQIHVLDAATDADGNAPLNGLSADQIGKGVTVWVWTGDSGDKVDEDTDLVIHEQGPVSNPTVPTKLTISPAQADTPIARFGTAVSFTGQLQYTEGGLDKDTTVGTDGETAAEYSLVKHVLTGTIDGTSLAVANATGAVTATDGTNALGVVSVSAPETLKTDADGKLTFSLSTSDPSATSTTDSRTVVYVLTPTKNAVGVAVAPGDPTRQSGYVVFAEESAKVTTVKVKAISAYAVVGTAANPATHGVTVTVTDQYGRPMRNQAVTLSSTNTSSTFPGARRTGSSGTVRIFYSHAGTAAATEPLTATWNGDAAGAADTGGPGCVTDEANGLDRCGTASVYWAVRAVDGAPAAATGIIAADLEENEIVVDDTTPTVVRYDANDIFSTSVPVDGTPTVTYRTMEEFEELLATVVAPANLALADGATGKRTATLTWAAYDADDEDARTFFTFVLTIA